MLRHKKIQREHTQNPSLCRRSTEELIRFTKIGNMYVLSITKSHSTAMQYHTNAILTFSSFKKRTPLARGNQEHDPMAFLHVACKKNTEKGKLPSFRSFRKSDAADSVTRSDVISHVPAIRIP